MVSGRRVRQHLQLPRSLWASEASAGLQRYITSAGSIIFGRQFKQQSSYESGKNRNRKQTNKQNTTKTTTNGREGETRKCRKNKQKNLERKELPAHLLK